MTSGDQKAEIIQQEVTMLLDSEAFARSRANRALLKFLGDEFLAGRGEAINEYTIAHDLLERDEGFDPSTDPIVRVRMRRLREAISTYYDGQPEAHVRLTIPRGGYRLVLEDMSSHFPQTGSTTDEPVQTIEHADAERGFDDLKCPPEKPSEDILEEASENSATPAAKRRRLHWQIGVFLIILVVGAGLLLSFWKTYQSVDPQPETGIEASGYPIVAIAPFANLTGYPANDIFEKGLQRQLAGDFQRFGRVKVRVLPTDLKLAFGDADYVLRGAILSLEGEVDLTIELSEPATGKILMTTRVTRSNDGHDYFESLRSLSQEVSGNMNAQGGVLSSLSQADLDQALGLPDAEHLGVFRCVVQTDTFLTVYDPETFISARECFETHADELKDDAIASASLGTLMLHAVPEFKLMDSTKLPKQMLSTADEVNRFAQNLADQFPLSDAGFILLGAVENAMGEHDLAIRALLQAVELNPANPTAYGVLAYAYTAADMFYEARDAALTAIQMSADPAPYLYAPLLMSGLVHKNARHVDIARKKIAQQASPPRDILLLAAASMIGDEREIDRLLKIVGNPADPLESVRSLVRGEIGKAVLERHLEAVGLDVPDPKCLDSVSGNVSRELDCGP